MLLQKRRNSNIQAGTFSNNVSDQKGARIAELVGDKCVISCRLNESPMEVLLDTGAQVSILSNRDLRKEIRSAKLQPMSSILDSDDSLRVQWGNHVDIPFSGWVNLNVTIGEGETKSSVEVPFLVTTEELERPILGFNAIKILANGKQDDVCKLFSSVIKSASISKVEAFVNLLQQEDEDVLFPARIKGKDVLLPAGKITQVPCKVKVGLISQKRAMLFVKSVYDLPEGIEPADSVLMLKPGVNNYFKIPVVNNTSREVLLRKNLVIGDVEYVNSITPLEVKVSEKKAQIATLSGEVNCSQKKEMTHGGMNAENEVHAENVINSIDLSGLTGKERKQVRTMLREESEVFAVNNTDVGNVDSVKMHINLKDQIPVHENYHAIPKPLYHELKCYIEDLLNKEFVDVHSQSPYSPH